MSTRMLLGERPRADGSAALAERKRDKVCMRPHIYQLALGPMTVDGTLIFKSLPRVMIRFRERTLNSMAFSTYQVAFPAAPPLESLKSVSQSS